jgi:hypothetical protein
MPDPSQFNTDRTYPGLWTITFSNPPINMWSRNDRRIGSAHDRSRGGPVREGRSVPVSRRPTGAGRLFLAHPSRGCPLHRRGSPQRLNAGKRRPHTLHLSPIGGVQIQRSFSAVRSPPACPVLSTPRGSISNSFTSRSA